MMQRPKVISEHAKGVDVFLDLEVIDSINAEVSPSGSTTVPAHMFYEIVRKLPDKVTQDWATSLAPWPAQKAKELDGPPLVALRDAHRREDGAGGVRSHQQVDLVAGHQLLVQRARQVRLGLVVLHDPLHLAAQQTAALVQVLHVDLAHQLVRQGRGRQRAGQGQRAADAQGLPLRQHRQGEGRAGGAGGGEKAAA